MTPTFDFAAFLNSPHAGPDAANVFPIMSQSALSSSLRHDTIGALDVATAPSGSHITFDEGNLLPDWASSINPDFRPTQLPMTPASFPANIGDAVANTSNGYRSNIAAHHFAKLRHCLPQSIAGADIVPAGLGGAGQRSNGGSHSAPSVPLSQAVRLQRLEQAKENQMTIQERRRVSRRSQPSPAVNAVAARPASKHASTAVNFAPPRSATSAIYVPGAEDAASANYDCRYNNFDPNVMKSIYSSTSFDLIGVLAKVAQRPNPKIDLGPVDLSCSFTVSDAQHPDQPIVHCSDTFCTLTGYSRDEIVGRNCRFLQAPDGRVEVGSERQHTDHGAVKHFRKHCSKMQECQASLINYRRDGTPFINLVTVVPITWGNSTEPVFLIGFQVDLVEFPGAISERSPNGLYSVNYSSDAKYVAQPDSAALDYRMAEITANADAAEEEEVSKRAMMAQEVADAISSGSKETSKWARVLLDNSNDLIHVLSLKGTFLYVSPSVERLLGYKAEEMVGKSISEFCHPSDVVPVFRELKDSTSNASIAAAARHWARVDGTVNPPTKGGAGQTGPQVNLVMRMKHKNQGHEWIENIGKLHLEQGKGRKVVISTGRSRPVYNLPWEQARRSLDQKGPGFWSKVSQKGLILSTSGSVSDVLESETLCQSDKATKTLAGMHMCDTVDADAMASFKTALQSSEVSGIPHLMNNGQGGEAVTVMSTLVPSSTAGETLPTVFMHTQLVSMADLGQMQINKIHSQVAGGQSGKERLQSALLKKGEPLNGSVFAELSTQKSTSWVFELHQLKIANKRLREEIRAQQRRKSGAKPTIVIPQQPSFSPSRHRNSLSKMREGLLSVSHGGSNSSGSASDVSMEPSLTPFGQDSGSGSGSGSDATVASSVINFGTDNPKASGMKRSRS